MNVRKSNLVVLFLVRLLDLPLRLALEEALLQHLSVLGVLLAQPVETLIEPGDAVRLSASVALDSASQTVHDRLSSRGEHLTHTGCLAHLLLRLLLLLLQMQLLLTSQAQLTGIQLVDRRLAEDVSSVPVRALARAHGDAAGGALRGLTGQEPPGLHTAP